MFTPKGKFGWYELMTRDTKTAGKFYCEVVGWTTQEFPTMDDFPPYTTFNVGSVGLAGLLNAPEHSAWIGYIVVQDVDAHIERIVAAGGKVMKPATDVPDMLRFAVMSDPQGATFAMFTPKAGMPSPEVPQPPTPGTIGWDELYTTDLDSGFEFYRSQFGWTKLRDIDMGEVGAYRIFDEGDHKEMGGVEMGDGGMMIKPPHIPTSCWTFYFQVDSIKAAVKRVKAGGGKVMMGPMQVPGGSWIIQGEDPQGVTFALVSEKE